MELMTSVLEIGLVFLVVLVAATIVERILEFFSIILEFIEPYIQLDKLWRRLGITIQKKFIKELEKAKGKDRKEIILILNVIQNILFRKDTPAGQPAILRIDLIRNAIMRLVMGIIGIVLGIFLCWRANLNIFDMMSELGVIEISINRVLAVIITGILVGSGTSPIHSIIKYAESKKEDKKREAEMARLKASLSHHQQLSREISQ